MRMYCFNENVLFLKDMSCFSNTSKIILNFELHKHILCIYYCNCICLLLELYSSMSS